MLQGKYYLNASNQLLKNNYLNLDFAVKYFKIPEPNSHRALQDAQLTRLLLAKIAEGEDLQIA